MPERRAKHGKSGPMRFGNLSTAFTRRRVPRISQGVHAYDAGYDLTLPDYSVGPWDCNNPYRAREVLEIVACALPRRDAQRFRRRLGALDELW